jgi:hypothetical protein
LPPYEVPSESTIAQPGKRVKKQRESFNCFRVPADEWEWGGEVAGKKGGEGRKKVLKKMLIKVLAFPPEVP